MKTVEDVVANLIELESTDRDWILDQLSAAQKSRLAAGLAHRPAAKAQQSPAAFEEVWPLDEAAAAAVADILKWEPAWIIRAVLQARQWKWEEAALAMLPAALRLEVAHLDRKGMKLSPAVPEALIRALNRIVDTTVVCAPVPGKASGFRHWFARIRAMGRA